MYEHISDGYKCSAPTQEEMKFNLKWRGEGDNFTQWIMLVQVEKCRWAEMLKFKRLNFNVTSMKGMV